MGNRLTAAASFVFFTGLVVLSLFPPGKFVDWLARDPWHPFWTMVTHFLVAL